MDDVEDNSELRRGIPVAHKIYGVPQTINTANYVYFQVFDLIFTMGAPSLSHTASPAAAAAAAQPSVEKLLVEELIALHRGQGMDLFWRDALVCPTEAEYVDMVNNKTGGLLRIALKLMLAHSSRYHGGGGGSSEQQAQQRPDLLPLVNLIGLLFQIRDDYMNLQSAAYASNKGFAEDLTEGKFSFPIIHSIRSSAPSGGLASSLDATAAASGAAPLAAAGAAQQQQERAAASANVSAGAPGGNRQLLSILRQRPTDEATKRYAVAYMRSVTRSFAYTRNVMRRLARLVERELAEVEEVLGENRALRVIVKRLEEGWGDEDDED
jgi:geranylgeranyl diphosphate synthase type 3